MITCELSGNMMYVIVKYNCYWAFCCAAGSHSAAADNKAIIYQEETK